MGSRFRRNFGLSARSSTRPRGQDAPTRTPFYTRALLSAVPAPDLDHRLDFAGLMEDKASDPSAWPPPFRVDAEHRPELVDVGGGHFVQAAAQHLEAAQ